MDPEDLNLAPYWQWKPGKKYELRGDEFTVEDAEIETSADGDEVLIDDDTEVAEFDENDKEQQEKAFGCVMRLIDANSQEATRPRAVQAFSKDILNLPKQKREMRCMDC